MRTSTRSQKVDLDEFLSRLRKTLLACAKIILPSSSIPSWASNCAQLLYSHKSVPPEPNEPGKLYISYLDDPSAVMLLGKSKDHKPIKRKLNIHSKRASSLITITSEHVDFATGKSFTCTGVGHDFESALDHYFSSSRLDKQDICKTNQNVEKKGDAFLLQKAINKKGNESWVEDIIKAVGKLFQLLPPEKHPPVVALIEKGIERLDQFIKENGNQSIANFYDPRLWLIVESICKHFDPLTGENASQRKEYRDYLIANSCSKLMQEEDITSSLDSYFQAMSMHQEIMETEKINNLTEVLKVLLDAYRKDNLYPEVEGHREKIKDYYERCKRHKNKADPERSEGSHSTP